MKREEFAAWWRAAGEELAANFAEQFEANKTPALLVLALTEEDRELSLTTVTNLSNLDVDSRHLLISTALDQARAQMIDSTIPIADSRTRVIG